MLLTLWHWDAQVPHLWSLRPPRAAASGRNIPAVRPLGRPECAACSVGQDKPGGTSHNEENSSLWRHLWQHVMVGLHVNLDMHNQQKRIENSSVLIASVSINCRQRR